MPKLTPRDKLWFRDYVAAAKTSRECLEFLLEYLHVPIALDYSVKSLEDLENLYCKITPEQIPQSVSDMEHLASLIGQYLGESIIYHTGAKWIQTTESNERFGQACIDGFRNEKWDRIYPIDIAKGFPTLPQRKPFFPGARDQRIVAAQLEKALRVFAESQ